MSLGRTYSVLCDAGRTDLSFVKADTCDGWIANAQTSADARGMAKRYGWVRRVDTSRPSLGKHDLCTQCAIANDPNQRAGIGS